MSTSVTARRLPFAASLVVGALLLSGCVYSEAAEETSAAGGAGAASGADAGGAEASAYLAAAPPRVPILGTGHDERDVDLITTMLAHYRTTSELARLLLEQPGLEPAYTALADRLIADQEKAIPALEALLAVWEEDATGHSPRLDGRPGPRSDVDINLALLEGQTESAGFAPFWLLTMRAHQEQLLGRAARAAEQSASADARRLAADFRDDYGSVDQALTDLGA